MQCIAKTDDFRRARFERDWTRLLDRYWALLVWTENTLLMLSDTAQNVLRWDLNCLVIFSESNVDFQLGLRGRALVKLEYVLIAQ